MSAGPAPPSAASIPARLRRLSDEERDVVGRVAELLRHLTDGTVALVVHHGTVIQVEMSETIPLS